MTTKKICILGGTGFVGRHLARRLAEDGHQIKILSRRREDARSILVIPSLTVVPGNVYDGDFLARQFHDHDVVINLVGVLHDSRRSNRGFEDVHVKFPALTVEACRRAGVPRLLHMSALQADPDGPSEYLKSRGRGEAKVFADAGNDIAVTAFRPSIIFGPDDAFTNVFAKLLRTVPVFNVLVCPKAKFQPIYVKDVATAFAHTLSDPSTIGKRYDLVGPQVHTMRDIVEFIDGVIGTNRKMIPVGPGLAKIMAFFMQFAPGKPLTPDNVRSMSVDNVSNESFEGLFGYPPASLADTLPGWLAAGRDRLDEFRSRPRRGRLPK